MDKMGLVILEKTGHVLGAFTQAVASAGDVSAEQVSGDGLLYRHEGTGDELAHVAPQHLKVVFVDRRDDVLLRSRLYVYVVKEKQVVPVAAPDPGVSLTYTPADKTLAIDMKAPVAQDVSGWVQLEGADQPIVAPLEIEDGKEKGIIDVTLTVGTTYSVLVLVPGFGAVAKTFTA